jgi:hypothetical protein
MLARLHVPSRLATASRSRSQRGRHFAVALASSAPCLLFLSGLTEGSIEGGYSRCEDCSGRRLLCELFELRYRVRRRSSSILVMCSIASNAQTITELRMIPGAVGHDYSEDHQSAPRARRSKNPHITVSMQS